MPLRLSILLHVLVFVGATAAVWWFVFPGNPAEAIADSLNAAAVAGYVEIRVAARWL